MCAKERRDDSFIKKPVYPGGPTAYRKFIKENLKYPIAAKTNKIEGTVFVKYSINHNGKVSEAKVIKGIGHGCDEEAIRIIKLLKFEIPKGPRKLRVLFHQKTQITFRLPKEKKVTPQKIVYSYQYLPATKKTEKQPPKKRSYTFTISSYQ